MFKTAYLAIAAISLSSGIIYSLDGRWWMGLACVLVGILWLLQLKFGVEFIPILNFLFFAAAGGVGIFLGYSAIWLLTNMVILLIAWDLDRFHRVLEPFSKDGGGANNLALLFRAHLARLGFAAVIGWSLGMIALRGRISLNLAGAVVLGLLVFLSLVQVVRMMRREGVEVGAD